MVDQIAAPTRHRFRTFAMNGISLNEIWMNVQSESFDTASKSAVIIRHAPSGRLHHK